LVTFFKFSYILLSTLENSGQNVKVIAERLGNTPAMIYDIYGYVLKELEQQSVDVFSNMLKIAKTK
jgi:phytoene/squalene synthetase